MCDLGHKTLGREGTFHERFLVETSNKPEIAGCATQVAEFQGSSGYLASQERNHEAA